MILNKFTLQILGACLLLVGAAWVFSDIVTYLVISLVISTILKPFTTAILHVQFFKLRMPRVLAVLLSFMLLIGLIGLFFVEFVPLILQQIQVLAKLKISDLTKSFDKPLLDLERFLLHNHVVSHERRGFLKNLIEANTIIELKRVDIQQFINNLITFTSQFFIGLIATLFISFFLLYDKGILKRFLISLVPNAYFELGIAALYKIERLLTNYLIGLTLQILSIFTLTALGLSIIGMEYAPIVAIFAAIINIIPYLGPLIGVLFSILIGLTTTPQGNSDDYLTLMFQILTVGGLVHLIDNIFLQPLIFGKSVKAHPLEIFVAIFAGSSLGGVIGMICAIPAYTILRVSVTEFYNGYQQYRIFNFKK